MANDGYKEKIPGTVYSVSLEATTSGWFVFLLFRESRENDTQVRQLTPKGICDAVRRVISGYSIPIDDYMVNKLCESLYSKAEPQLQASLSAIASLEAKDEQSHVLSTLVEIERRLKDLEDRVTVIETKIN
ncbi:MAG: hypothetical protein ACFFCZ_11045 [Promethearchaeota archaeon]